ncbi:MAG: FecR domain-containing protein [Phycisphaerae bacterium]|nr:FecR domain-containing protein [Phycisphaerae bacterium]
MDESHKKYEMCDLMLGSLDGQLSDEQAQALGDFLRNDSDAREYYSDIMSVVSLLHSPGQWNVQGHISCGNDDDNVLLELLEEQWAARCVVDIPVPNSDLPVISCHRKQLAGRPLFRVAGAIAAMIIFAFMLNNLPKLISEPTLRPSKYFVARLIESNGAIWTMGLDSNQNNQEMIVGMYELSAGLVHIELFDGANVIIEAPAKFELESDSRLFLFSGKLTANVPRGSEGFKVATPSADYVDIGTEFGIKVGDDGSSEMYVFDGEVLLYPGDQANTKSKSIRVRVGESKGVEKASGKVSNSSINKFTFARKLPDTYEIALRKTYPQAYWSFDQARARGVVNKIGDKVYPGQLKAKSKVVLCGQMEPVIRFTSEGDRIDFGDVLDPGRDSYSVALWFNVDKLDSKFDQVLATKRSFKGGGYPGWTIFVNRDSLFIRTGDGDDARSHVWIKNLHCMTAGWHQVVMVIDREDNVLRGYFDGSDEGWEVHSNDGISPEHDRTVAYGTYRDGTVIENECALSMNAYVNVRGEKRNFKGMIYDMGIWKRALSLEEIQDIYRNCLLSK